ncbi:hypothetical protein KDA10_03970, partial [candidate division WWE3 bacterium]|nr:hypothetical protein [candidate division WWE3 bacterium]
DANWQRNYEQILANKEITSQDKYRENLQEVTVSRNAVKVLKKFFPARADYYQELYDESVKQNKQIVPNVSEVVEQTYIPTGFKP